MEFIVTKQVFNEELEGKAVIIHGSTNDTAFEGETWLVKSVYPGKIYLLGCRSSHEEIILDDVASGNIELTLLEVPSHVVKALQHYQNDEPSYTFNLDDRWSHNKAKHLYRIVDIDYEDRRIRVCPLSDSNNIRTYGFEHFQKDYTFYTSYKGDI